MNSATNNLLRKQKNFATKLGSIWIEFFLTSLKNKILEINYVGTSWEIEVQ